MAVFDVLSGGPVIAGAGIDGDVRFDIKKFAQGHELIGADVVGLKRAPNRIIDRRTFVGVANGIAPFMGGNKIAAGKTVNAGAKALEDGDGIRAEAMKIVGGHERNRADMERTGAGADDFKLGGRRSFQL